MGLVPMVIESSPRGERAFDIYSRLLKDRIIFLGTPINDLFAEMLQNIRIVGGFLKKKVWFYNCGSILFVIGVTLFVCGF